MYDKRKSYEFADSSHEQGGGKRAVLFPISFVLSAISAIAIVISAIVIAISAIVIVISAIVIVISAIILIALIAFIALRTLLTRHITMDGRRYGVNKWDYAEVLFTCH